MLSVLPWLMLAALFVLPVILRLFAGEDSPDNTIAHESAGDDDGEDGRDGLPLAA